MKLDTFTFNRPQFYKKKAEYIYRIKRGLYALAHKDLDGDWKALIDRRSAVLDRHCKGKSVLDVGCGVGDLLNELDKIHGAGKLTGVDISAPMIKKAKELYPGFDFSIGSADRLPFKDNSFDVLTFQWVFHHLDPSRTINAIKEAVRVARETVIIQDTLHYDSDPMRTLGQIYWKLADGGICYRTKAEWRRFFENRDLVVLDELSGSVMRTCLYALSVPERKEASGA